MAAATTAPSLQERFVDTANVDLVFLEYSLNDGYVVRRNAAALEPGGSCPTLQQSLT